MRLALGILAAGVLTSAAMAQTRADASNTNLPAGAETVGTIVNDPFQAFNRASYGFSMGLDRWVTGPIAHAYMAVAPDPVRDRVSAAVNNLGEPRTLLNDIAQGRPKRAGVTASRFVINSIAGMLGLFDVATDLDLPQHRGDFGQTLGRYGVEPGAFLYIPVLGPLTVREGAGRVVDIVTDPVTLVGGNFRTPFGATRLGVTVVNKRASLDPQIAALEDAMDPYATVRSAYLQGRAALVREATGEVQALPDFDDAPSASSESTPPAAAPSTPGP
ncbi:VacJ family lipoprotein [Caulobacter sp. 1776]|uniref:MlaA family lipoprotein n=1 Tax=Caulobacter sp. 1776 TaxID=3156420 RepID=UPI0033934B42